MSQRNNSTRNISLFVGLISLCALFVSLYQAKIMRQQNEVQLEAVKAQLWPRLSLGIDRSYDNGELSAYTLLIINKGSGPAIIDEVRVTHAGTEASDWWHIFKLSNIPDSIPTFINTANIRGNVIRPGEVIRVLDLTDNTELMQAYFPAASHTDISICYSSVFGDTWQLYREGLTSTLQSITVDVKECTIQGSIWEK